MKFKHLHLSLLSFLFALAPQLCLANLGGNEASIGTDATAFGGTLGPLNTTAEYSTQDIVTDGFTVREFLSKTGVVFGVIWKGMHAPELSQILGKYFNEYQFSKSKMRNKLGRAPISLQGRSEKNVPTSLRVEQGGHMRAITGKAYDASLLPQGVAANEIQF